MITPLTPLLLPLWRESGLELEEKEGEREKRGEGDARVAQWGRRRPQALYIAWPLGPSALAGAKTHSQLGFIYQRRAVPLLP